MPWQTTTQTNISTNIYTQSKWCQWQQSWSYWNDHMHTWIPQEISATIDHLQTPTLNCHFTIRLSHNYLIGIGWFSANQLHPCQGPKSIVISDPAPFVLHVNQIATLPPLHILVKTVSQVTIPPRTLAIVSTTFNSIPKPHSYYNFIQMSVPYKSQ